MDDECITAMTKYYCMTTMETEMKVKQVWTQVSIDHDHNELNFFEKVYDDLLS